MKMLARIFALLLVCSSFSGCLYSKIKVPLDKDASQTVLGSKVGMASNQSVMWLVAWGDGGTEAAARNGGIQVIHHMDEERFALFFGAYVRITTIVYGD